MSTASIAPQSVDRPFLNQSLIPRIAASSFGSLITAFAVTPLEVVKVRQQAGSVSIPTRICPGCGTFLLNNGLMECLVPKMSVPHFEEAATPIASSKNTGIISTLSRIFRNEGLAGIYAGLTPTLVMSVPGTVLYFTAYDEFVSRLRHPVVADNLDTKWNNVLVPVLSGTSARILASFATSPLDLVRTKQASRGVRNGPSQSMLSEMKTMVRTEGPLSLYKGLVPTLMRDAPFSAIYWLFLEYFKRKLYWCHMSSMDANEQKRRLSPSVEVSHNFLSGAGAGMIAAFFTTPFDVVKTRQQIKNLQRIEFSAPTDILSKNATCNHGIAKSHNRFIMEQGTIGSSKANGTGMIQLMYNIFKSEGLRGLWRGNQTRMIKVAPACAIMISSYEVGKRLFELDSV